MIFNNIKTLIIKNKTKSVIFIFVCLFIAGFILPEKLAIPVQGASSKDWNQNAFWYEPWGKSGTHKGIDIFFPTGTPVISSTYGFVIFKGEIELGGKVVAILGPKWRIHYYAHLNDYNVKPGSLVRTNEPIGTVGDSGNAVGKPPHLHFTILSLVPHFWKWDLATQGWKKMFYLNPGDYLLNK